MDEREPRPLLAGRLRTDFWRWVDAGAAVLLAAAFGTGEALTGWAPATAAVLLWLPIAVRRRWPVPVLYAVLTGTVVSVLSLHWEEAWLVVPLALYTVASQEPRRRAVTALVSALAAVAVTTTLIRPATPGQTISGIVFVALLLTVPWLIGTAQRDQRLHARVLARQAVTDERLRIARELHDMVAHHLTVITVRAEVARAVAATNPGEVEKTLALVGAAGRTALADMRHMLGVLRTPLEEAQLGPVPGLADLPALVATAGPRVELWMDPEVELLPTTGLTVYRIVQEALTNVVRHAESADCRVTVSRTAPDGVDVDIVNAPPPRAARFTGRRAGGGHGLVGMRERATMCGGTCTAGPLADGGFRVHARLPGTDGGAR
ncbi:sensor histidine kinase [Streptomyces sp. NPDC059578]|uniref:sensor histidine kinase n=1 Tax=unclassified Streptomyces TaxID=2593676 RepID=UPI00364FD163